MDKNEIYESCKFRATSKGKYKLTEDFNYGNIKIRKDYETNGANIPRIFWILIPPFRPDLLPAIFLHDYLTDREEYLEADRLFKRILEDMEVKKYERRVLVGSVKAYHWVRYGV